MAGWVHSAVLKESKTPASLRLCITLLPCSLRYHGSGLRWASKNLSLSKMDTPASLICKLCKLAKLQNQTDFMPAGDVVQQVWWSQWAQPAHMWEAKAKTIDFFTGRLKDSCWHNGACLVLHVLCVCFKTKSPRGMQPFLEVYCEFPSQFPSHFPTLKLPYPWEQRVLSACSEVAMPFRDTPGSLQSLGARCFLVQDALDLQQKLQCKGLSIRWDFRNTTH